MNKNIDGGYKSFICYISTKAHFKSKNYDITKGLLNNNKTLNSWNEKHFNTDGKLFYVVEQHYPKKQELIFLYSIYQYHNKDFFVTDCISDKFQLWDKHRKELLQLNNTLDTDLVTIMEYCIKHEIKLKDLFRCSSILRLNISPFSLVIIGAVFKITENIKLEDVAELERKKIAEKLLALDKLTLICYPKFKDTDWKEIIKQKLRSN